MNEEAVTRVLAAIVVLDVVGYSRLMGRDDEGTLARMRHYRADIIDPFVALYRGRIVNAAGDSILMDFVSVIAATRCAIALQQALAERNEALPEYERLVFRLGVHLGDVIVGRRGVFGDSVNVAARLETLAEPGGVCLSSAAYEQVRGKIEAAFTDLGPREVKNIVHPIGVYALTAADLARTPKTPPPRREINVRRRAIAACAALAAFTALGGLWAYLGRDPARSALADQLDAILQDTQARMSDKTRANLIALYVAGQPHRAFAVAPKAKSHLWAADWPSAKSASEKTLERCQITFAERCQLVAVDGATTPSRADNPRDAHDMPRVRYAGDFDLEQIPGVRRSVIERSDVAGYAKAPSPKAAAIHGRGLLTTVSGAASQYEAEAEALRQCNQADAGRTSEGPCLLYASGGKVVLPRRQTVPIAPSRDAPP